MSMRQLILSGIVLILSQYIFAVKITNDIGRDIFIRVLTDNNLANNWSKLDIGKKYEIKNESIKEMEWISEAYEDDLAVGEMVVEWRKYSTKELSTKKNPLLEVHIFPKGYYSLDAGDEKQASFTTFRGKPSVILTDKGSIDLNRDIIIFDNGRSDDIWVKPLLMPLEQTNQFDKLLSGQARLYIKKTNDVPTKLEFMEQDVSGKWYKTSTENLGNIQDWLKNKSRIILKGSLFIGTIEVATGAVGYDEMLVPIKQPMTLPVNFLLE